MILYKSNILWVCSNLQRKVICHVRLYHSSALILVVKKELTHQIVTYVIFYGRRYDAFMSLRNAFARVFFGYLGLEPKCVFMIWLHQRRVIHKCISLVWALTCHPREVWINPVQCVTYAYCWKIMLILLELENWSVLETCGACMHTVLKYDF